MVEASNEAERHIGVDLVSTSTKTEARIQTYTFKETNKERKKKTMMGRQPLLSWSL
jgi:hypothetical protein